MYVCMHALMTYTYHSSNPCNFFGLGEVRGLGMESRLDRQHFAGLVALYLVDEEVAPAQEGHLLARCERDGVDLVDQQL